MNRPQNRMTTVLAAIDRSLAAKPVLTTASALANALGAHVLALHVQVDSMGTPSDLARSAGVRLSVVRGSVVEQLVAAGEADDVAALVIGARSLPTDPRPLGETAMAVSTTLLKPVVVVQPDAELRSSLRRVLVPLEGDLPTSLAPRRLIEIAPNVGLDVIAVHVMRPEEIPAFTDQPQHEQHASAREFLARFCPWGIDVVRFETRIGRREELIPLVAQEFGCDLIVLGWQRRLTAGRARVVRATLASSRIPVMLVPIIAADPADATERGSDRAAGNPML
jgi:nucleotide-binding universal stress UspA family protein